MQGANTRPESQQQKRTNSCCDVIDSLSPESFFVYDPMMTKWQCARPVGSRQDLFCVSPETEQEKETTNRKTFLSPFAPIMRQYVNLCTRSETNIYDWHSNRDAMNTYFDNLHRSDMTLLVTVLSGFVEKTRETAAESFGADLLGPQYAALKTGLEKQGLFVSKALPQTRDVQSVWWTIYCDTVWLLEQPNKR